MQKLVLVVDDAMSNLTMTASVLEKEYRVLTMLSAVKMFSLLEKKRPDMILLDIEMPEMNGFEAIAKLKESPQWKDIPVVFLTGHEDEAILSQAMELGALGLLKKPVKPSVLLDYVQKNI